MKIAGSSATEIYESVRKLCTSRQLLPGELLPPVRELAEHLGVNRNTVAAAYRRLVVSGIAIAQGRLGTSIADQQGPGEQEGATPESPLVDLASGNPHAPWLPDANAVLAKLPFNARLYGEQPVNSELKTHAREWLKSDCPGEFEIDLTNGAVDAIERLLAAHVIASDRVAVESPCFLSSINVLRIAGIRAVGVRVDSEGMSAEHLEAALAKGARAVILTPRAHNPTGCSLTEKRARALRRVLAKYPQVFVIVDDHFALLSNSDFHSIIPPSTLHWALIRSVSKVLGPDLRVAVVASDPQTSSRLRLRLACGTNWVSHLLQDIVHACLTSPKLAKEFDKAKADYSHKRHLLHGALARHGIPLTPDADGLNIWIPLRQDSQPLCFALARKGWLVRGGEVFSVGEQSHGVRITISDLSDELSEALAVEIRRFIT